MNQILYTIEDENKNNRTKSILLFFGITLIIFGLALTGTGGYNLYASNIRKKEEMELAKVPVITISNESNKVKINVEHVRNIKNIIYTWNDGEEVTINEKRSSGINEYLDIPAGTNTLKVKATDVDGVFSTVQGEYSYEGTYMDLSVIDSKNLKIQVTDVEGLQSVKYRWNSEEEVMQEAENINTKTMEITTDIPIGINTITVTAVNNRNEKESKEMTVQGITKPTIKVNYNSDRTLFTMKLNDDQGIESYSYKLYNAKVEDVAENGQLLDNFKEKLIKQKENEVQASGDREITDKLALAEGFNYLEIKVKNIEGAESVITGWCVK